MLLYGHTLSVDQLFLERCRWSSSRLYLNT